MLLNAARVIFDIRKESSSRSCAAFPAVGNRDGAIQWKHVMEE